MQDSDTTSNSERITDEWRARVETSVREAPSQAVAVALVAGIVLTLFPIGRILAGVVRLFFSLLKPALFILGMVKLAQEIDKRKKP